MAEPVPDMEGLKRRDAVLLIAAAARRRNQSATRGLHRLRSLVGLYVVLRFSVRRRARRLEERCFLEPGSRFAWNPEEFRLEVTPLGRRAAAVAAAMFELEDFRRPL